jgi:hypothetical protein
MPTAETGKMGTHSSTATSFIQRPLAFSTISFHQKNYNPKLQVHKTIPYEKAARKMLEILSPRDRGSRVG